MSDTFDSSHGAVMTTEIFATGLTLTTSETLTQLKQEVLTNGR